MEYRKHNWEQQREQLSALLDNQLGEQERAALEAHLRDCAECQAELASLQKTSALLRALPQPALPRTFTLSLDAANGATEEPPKREPVSPSASQPAQHPRSLAQARRQRQKRRVQIVQWLSTVAAVLGLLLLLSTAFSSLHTASFVTTASNGANSAPAPDATRAAGYATPPLVGTGGVQTTGNGSPAATPDTSAATPTPVPQETAVDNSSGNTAFNSGTPWFVSAASLGILLLLLGTGGFAAAWILRRQA